MLVTLWLVLLIGCTSHIFSKVIAVYNAQSGTNQSVDEAKESLGQ